MRRCDFGRTGVALSGEHLKNRVALVEEDAEAAAAFGESFLSVERPQQANSSDYDNTKTLVSFLDDGPAPCSDVLMHTTLPHSAMLHTCSFCTIPKIIWSSLLGGQYKQPPPAPLNPSNTYVVLIKHALLILHAIQGGQG